MIRSTLSAFAAAVLLLASPAANAQPAGALSVSDTNPDVGQSFSAVVEAGLCEGIVLTVDAPAGSVTIDGERTLEATKSATGPQVTFAVVIGVEGDFRIVSECVEPVEDEEGYALNDGAGAVEVVVSGDVIAPAEAEKPGGILPSTGSGAMDTLIAGTGLALLLAGVVLLLSRRRRSVS